ncbi:MAG: 2-oxo acid dehydrogenase subunit E2, partial [Psychromonas sp.]|nr:2-oxo acid dehydrogenase subunit E2 [Psychromonas sp.]
ESVAEATITSWLKEIGDTIEADEAVLEIATDKVDSEVPSEVDGVLVEKLFNVDDVVQVGQTIAVIEIEGTADVVDVAPKTEVVEPAVIEAPVNAVAEVTQTVVAAQTTAAPVISSTEGRFYSPLVRNIAKKEGVAQAELDTIPGTGKEGRVTKNDILEYVKNKGNQPVQVPVAQPEAKVEPVQVKNNGIETPKPAPVAKKPAIVSSGDDE